MYRNASCCGFIERGVSTQSTNSFNPRNVFIFPALREDITTKVSATHERDGAEKHAEQDFTCHGANNECRMEEARCRRDDKATRGDGVESNDNYLLST